MGLVITDIKYIVFYIPPNWLQLFSIHISLSEKSLKSLFSPMKTGITLFYLIQKNQCNTH